MPKPFFSRLQFVKSKNPPGMPSLPSSVWPKEWTTIHFKTYPRFRRWKLKPTDRLSGNISEILTKRRSKRDFHSLPLTFTELSNLLYWSGGLQRVPPGVPPYIYRMYASGGARYPLEIYPLILRGPIPAGLYHYNVYENSLELMWEKNILPELDKYLLDISQWKKAAVILFITAVFDRNQQKYGERGYRVILKEAGGLGQNIYLVSAALNLKCCAVGGFVDDTVNRLLDIDGSHEAALYSLVIGK